MKKKILTLTFLLAAASSALTALAQKTVYNHVFAPSEGLVNKTETQFRPEICLNGYWDFQPVATPGDFKYGSGKAPELTKPVDGKWDRTRIKIPSPWNVNDFANRNLEGPDHRNYPSYPKEWESVKMAWMRKTVDVPTDWSRRAVRLYFEAVAGDAEVWVNGQKVGENFDLMLPFSFDVTDVVKLRTEERDTRGRAQPVAFRGPQHRRPPHRSGRLDVVQQHQRHLAGRLPAVSAQGQRHRCLREAPRVERNARGRRYRKQHVGKGRERKPRRRHI